MMKEKVAKPDENEVIYVSVNGKWEKERLDFPDLLVPCGR